MNFFSADDISRLISLREVRGLMREVLKASPEDHLSPPRFAFGDKAPLGVMPEAGGDLCSLNGVKVVSLSPGLGHEGILVVFDRETGKFRGAFDAAEITALRTAAVSAVVTEVLMGEQVDVVGFIGTGRQALAHTAAFRDLYPHAHFMAAGRSGDIAEVFAKATVVCTLTSARTPLSLPERLPPRIHVNAVGSCKPTHRELPGEFVGRALRFVDSLARVERETGDFVLAKAEGHLSGEMGVPVRELLLSPQNFRRNSGVTLFKSLGLPCEDLALAELILSRAERSHGEFSNATA